MQFVGKYLIDLISFGMDMSSLNLKKLHYYSFEKMIDFKYNHIYGDIDNKKRYFENFPECLSLFA